MSFAEEWANLKKAAADRQASTNLAGIAPEYDNTGKQIIPEKGSGSGGQGEALKATPESLRLRARKTDTVRSNFKKADDEAITATTKAASALKGFDSQKGLKSFESRWKAQARYLDGLLDKGVAQGLRLAANDIAVNDQKQANKMKHDSKNNEK